jgi:hypothetical protein
MQHVDSTLRISRIDIGLLEAGFQIPSKLNVDIKSLHFRPRPIRAERSELVAKQNRNKLVILQQQTYSEETGMRTAHFL